MDQIEADAIRLGRFSTSDLERLGYRRGQIRAFVRLRCVGDGCRPGVRGTVKPVSMWRVRERAA